MSPRTDSTSITEGDLVERAKHEREAFGELYRRHRLEVYRFAFARAQNRADAEDLTSEVFVRALAAIGRYQDRGVPFRSWLFQIAANLIATQHRRRRPIEDLDQHQDLAADVSLEDLIAARDQVWRIGLAAKQLPAGQRTILALRFGRDLSHAQIGGLTGRSAQSSKIGLVRAIARVRQAIRAGADVLELAS